MTADELAIEIAYADAVTLAANAQADRAKGLDRDTSPWIEAWEIWQDPEGTQLWPKPGTAPSPKPKGKPKAPKPSTVPVDAPALGWAPATGKASPWPWILGGAALLGAVVYFSRRRR